MIDLCYNFKSKLLAFTVLTFSFILNAKGKDKESSSPNVILFFMDDLGYGDLSSTGALGYNTPNIDRLAMAAPSIP